MKSLKALVAKHTKEQVPDIWVQGFCLDSRKIQAGDVFFALLGSERDGRRYIEEAIEKGAVAVITDLCAPLSTFHCSVPVVYITELSKKVSELSASFYDSPSKSLTVIGITGTNGKTTCTQLLGKAFRALHRNTATIGTLGVDFGEGLRAGQLTTPDPVRVQALLAEATARQCEMVVMEVSSHALSQARVEAIQFTTAVFTNLSQDHLDYHGSMAAYGAAKARLFKMKGVRHAVINCDDPFSAELLDTIAPLGLKVWTFGTKDTQADFKAEQVVYREEGLLFKVHSAFGSALIDSTLMGDFNVSNVLAVITTLCIHGVLFEEACMLANRMEPVMGRMQRFGGGGLPLIVVDYAHTPEALKQALMALRKHCRRRLWCVFGCGGDRDKNKRALMGKVACDYADKIVVTSDNPRGEDPREIVHGILEGIASTAAVEVELDRLEALRYAFTHALPDDVILVAGKGHETVQTIGREQYDFSDALKVQQLLDEMHYAVG